MDAEPEEHTLLGSTVAFPTPPSSTYTGNYGYISPVFFEMEDPEFPRVPDPLPDVAVEETIRIFHNTAAEAEIELRRHMVSGTLDDGELEQLVNAHMSAMEQHARKAVEDWKAAREAAIEERRAEEQRARMAEEQKRRLAEAKKQGLGKKGAKWPGLSTVEEVPRAASPAVQAKKPQAKNRRTQLLEESFGARPATPAHLAQAQAQQRGDDELSPWERQAAAKAAEGKPTFAFLAQQAQQPPPVQPPVPAPSPWAQLARAPAQRNPFSPQAAQAPEPSLSPWETMMAKKMQAPPMPQPQDAWEEDNTDDSEEGVSSWTQQMLNSARSGAASAWGMASSAIGGGERPGTPAQLRAPTRPSAPVPAAPAAQETPWAADGLMARSVSNGPTTPEDPRFATWRPPRIVEHDEHNDPAKKMQDLAFQNLFETADDESDPSDLLNAMSMYAKATQSAARKKTAPSSKR